MSEFWQAVANNTSGFWGGIGGGLVVTLLSWLIKAWIERKNYVSKVRFDAEFAIYKELLVATDEMIRAIAILYEVNDIKAKSVDEVIPLCGKACTKYSQYNRILARNSVFIPRKTCEKFEQIKKIASRQVNWISSPDKAFIEVMYYEKLPLCHIETKGLIVEYNKLKEYLRNYLNRLDVI